MQAITSREGSVTILKPLGPLVASELDDLDQAFQELVQKWTRRVVINMSNATFLDSAALELLCRYQEQMSEHGLKMKLCNLSDISDQIFDLTRLARRFEIYPDTNKAIRSFL